MDSPSIPASSPHELPLQTVAEAWKSLQPALWPTCPLPSPGLERLTGYRVWLKPENLQRTGSFKIRGAYYKLHQLRNRSAVRKVVAASAGNHAQGVAYAARELGLDCVIVMPERAPLPKRRATESYGARVLLEGSCFDDSLAFALQLAPAEGREFISPFNDLDVITGQSTLAWEALEELRDDPPDAVVVPVGGAGLLAGVAGVVKQRLPKARIVAVQSSCAPAYIRSWNTLRKDPGNGTPTPPLPMDVPTQETIADGVRVRRPGDLCWEMTRDLVDAAIVVDDAAVYRGILFLLEDSKLVAEGAGALGVAALLDPAARAQLRQTGIEPGARVLVLVTGGNIDSLTLQRVVERSAALNGRSQALTVRIKDEPGQLGHILDFLRHKRAVVLDLRRSWHGRPLVSDVADIEILIETEDEHHRREVLQALANEAKALHFELLLETPEPNAS